MGDFFDPLMNSGDAPAAKAAAPQDDDDDDILMPKKEEKIAVKPSSGVDLGFGAVEIKKADAPAPAPAQAAAAPAQSSGTKDELGFSFLRGQAAIGSEPPALTVTMDDVAPKAKVSREQTRATQSLFGDDAKSGLFGNKVDTSKSAQVVASTDLFQPDSKKDVSAKKFSLFDDEEAPQPAPKPKPPPASSLFAEPDAADALALPKTEPITTRDVPSRSLFAAVSSDDADGLFAAAKPKATAPQQQASLGRLFKTDDAAADDENDKWDRKIADVYVPPTHDAADSLFGESTKAPEAVSRAEVDQNLLHVGTEELSIGQTSGSAASRAALGGGGASVVTTQAATVDLDDDLFSMGGGGGDSGGGGGLDLSSMNINDYINQNKREGGASLFG